MTPHCPVALQIVVSLLGIRGTVRGIGPQWKVCPEALGERARSDPDIWIQVEGIDALAPLRHASAK